MDRDGEQLSKPRGLSLHTKILLGLVVGAVLGVLANFWIQGGQPASGGTNLRAERVEWYVTNIIEPFGRLFLRLVLSVVLPLVFSALVLGVLGIGDMRRLGRVGVTSLLLTIILSGTSVAIGLGLVNFIRPGDRISQEKREALQEMYAAKATGAVESAEKAKSLPQILLDLIPENPVQEAAGALDGSSKGNGMLAIMVFSLVFGVALALIPEERSRPIVGVLEGLFDVTMVIIGWAMWLAPYGVACLVFGLVARLGADVLWTLAWFVGTVLLGLGLQMFVVYPLFLFIAARRSPLEFFRNVSDAMLTAFGTSSSNATLPTSLRVAEQNLRLPPSIARFVLTVGSTANQNGTGLYEGVVVLFLAQVFGVELTLSQQLTVVLMSVLAGVGTAGVPGGSLPLIVVVLKATGVSGDGIAIILGVDRLLDMCRTVLNVTGDLALAAGVSAWERGDRELEGAGERGA